MTCTFCNGTGDAVDGYGHVIGKYLACDGTGNLPDQEEEETDNSNDSDEEK